MKINYLFVLVLICAQLPPAYGKSDVPQPGLRLFTIARSKNANIMCYDAHVASGGKFDETEPVTAYWKMKAQDGHLEAMNDYEREHVYGFSVQMSPDHAHLNLELQALKVRVIHVSISDGTPVAETKIQGNVARLRRIFVESSGGIIPGVKWIKLTGTDPKSGEQVSETIHP